jgi:uncharacterized membrane protein
MSKIFAKRFHTPHSCIVTAAYLKCSCMFIAQSKDKNTYFLRHISAKFFVMSVNMCTFVLSVYVAFVLCLSLSVYTHTHTHDNRMIPSLKVNKIELSP